MTLIRSTLLLLFTAAPTAFALPGEADAVIRHCGQPHAQHMGTSVLNDTPQRDLIYNDITLHFEPAGSGWSFTTAWRGHFPVTRNQLEESLPCFRAAIQEVAATPHTAIDPTTALQTGFTPTTNTSFGIPHLWLIALLVGCVILIILLIPRRTPQPLREPLAERPYRKPTLYSRVWKRRPPNSPLS